jgi:nitrous oxidase accessory protein
MFLAPTGWAATVNVNTVSELVSTVNNGSAGDTINVAAGTYSLTASLKPKANMTIKGAGIAKTILKPASSWKPGNAAVIEPINWSGVNPSAYLFYLGNNNGNHNVTISDMEIDGLKQLQGAVVGNTINNLTIYNVYFHDFTFCGVRVVGGSKLVIHDSEFINMAINGMDPESGAVVFAWLSNSEFYNNRIYFATRGVYYGSGVNAGNFYGFKGRLLKNSRIHHNTIMVNFSIELPFDDNFDVEIDHNYLDGWISIPKHAGGSVPPSGVSCRIHHNYDTSSVVAEYPRNAVEIDHNLLDNPRSEGGSMLSGWTSESAPGPTKMHDNLINNLGRVLGDVGLYNNLQFYNNHVKAPANAGAGDLLWIIDGNIDKSKFVFRDNIVDCTGKPRALLWKNLGAGFTSIKNNTLINVTDQANYANPNTGLTRGPLEQLNFTCGANDEYRVNQWTIRKTGGGSTGRPLVHAPTGGAQCARWFHARHE